MSAFFKFLFLLTSAASAGGFVFAKKIHTSNGPSKVIADFSIFMAYSFGIYLFACLASAFLCAAAGEFLLSGLLALCFVFPFLLAYLSRPYARADAAFNLQIVGLACGAAAMILLDAGVRAFLSRFF